MKYRDPWVRTSLVAGLFGLASLAGLACGPGIAGDGVDDAGDDGDGDGDGGGGGGGDGGDGDGDGDGGDGDGDDGGDDDGDAAWWSCERTSECILASNSCCPTCGSPSIDDVDGIHVDRWTAHHNAVCDEPDPACPPCAPAANPWLTVTCEAAACEPIDLRRHPANSCNTDDDCRLRTSECCECGASTEPWHLIAWPVGAHPDLWTLVCDPDQTCDLCQPLYPEDDFEAYCDLAGRCDLRPR